MKTKLKKFELSSMYQQHLSELENVLKPRYKKSVKELRKVDLNDYFFQPEKWFENDNQAKGFVLALFMKSIKKIKTQSN